jgi:O-acetylhomoserine (thiol)-lyase
MERHSENALAVAKHLKDHAGITWVSYPGLEGSPGYETGKKVLPNGGSALVAFGIEGGRDVGRKFIDSLEMFSHVANIGDAKSLAIHPATTTHSQLNDEELESAGVSPDMVRLSVGIESIEDIKADIDQALAKAS